MPAYNRKSSNARHAPITITPLADEVRVLIPTAEAALHLNRSEQTLRWWHCKG